MLVVQLLVRTTLWDTRTHKQHTHSLLLQGEEYRYIHTLSLFDVASHEEYASHCKRYHCISF
jgi:hypothetical protein